jgi:hypothetical protein
VRIVIKNCLAASDWMRKSPFQVPRLLRITKPNFYTL